MIKKRILGLILSISMVMNTMAVFMQTAEAATSKLSNFSLSETIPAHSDNLMAEWIFSGTNGQSPNSFTSSVNDYTLTKTGNVSINDSNAMGSSIRTYSGGGMKFTPASEEELNLTSSSATYETWVNISGANSYNGYGYIMRRVSDSGVTWGLLTKENENGKGYFEFERGDEYTTFEYNNVNTSTSVDANPDWQHLVVVKDITGGKENDTVYLNGVKKATISLDTVMEDEGELHLSHTKDVWHQEYRWFANLRVFSSALSDDDVMRLYKNQAIHADYTIGDATITGMTVNGEEIDLVVGTKEYVKPIANNVETVNFQTIVNGTNPSIVYTMNNNVVDNTNIPLKIGDNVITVTSSAAGENNQIYTVNLLRLPKGNSPARNADLSDLSKKTQVADWYFDAADGAKIVDETNGIKLVQSGVNGDVSVASFSSDSIFNKVMNSAAGAGRKAKSTGSVTPIDNAKTWSGWVDTSFKDIGNISVATIWGKSKDKNYGYASGHTGWVLQMVRGATADDSVTNYRYTITRGVSTYSNAEKWQTVNTYQNIKTGDWKYITISHSDNYGTAPSLYINGVKQELTLATNSGKTSAVASDAGVGVDVGFTDHSLAANVKYANLRIFKEKFTDKDALNLYYAEGIAAGLLDESEIPQEPIEPDEPDEPIEPDEPDEPEEVTPLGPSPVRNANLSAFTEKLMVADWYFDVADGVNFVDEINGIKLEQYGVNGIMSEPKFAADGVFKKNIRSEAGAWTREESSGSVAAIDDAKTWSGWINSNFANNSGSATVTVWGKCKGQNYGFDSRHKGWTLQQVKSVVDGKVFIKYQIMRGNSSGMHERWITNNTFTAGEWIYVTLSNSSNYKTMPSLYINGVKQELSLKQDPGTTKTVASDAGIGVTVGYTNHSTDAKTWYANLRVFKEQFTDEEALALYHKEAIAVGYIIPPVEIKMTKSGENVIASTDLSEGVYDEDTTLVIARYSENDRLEACDFTTKGSRKKLTASVGIGDDTDIIKGFVWDGIKTMTPLSEEPAVYFSEAMANSGFLSDITIENGELNPQFRPGIKSYTVETDKKVVSFTTTASEADMNILVQIGLDSFENQDSYVIDIEEANSAVITVSKDDFTQQVYTLSFIYRGESREIYVSKQGSDSASGTKDSPFATIEKAVNTARADSGDIIRIMPGTYTIEKVVVPSGVSIIGSGVDVTTLQATAVNTNTSYIDRSMTAIECIDGRNIELAHFTLDGTVGEDRAHMGIIVHNCENVIMHDMQVSNFYYVGVWPTKVTNGHLYNMRLHNSGKAEETGCTSSIMFGDCKNVSIHDSLITEDRGAYGIKASRHDWVNVNVQVDLGKNWYTTLDNLKIYNCDIDVRQRGAWGNGQPGIGIEIWSALSTNCEIFNNRISDSVSLPQWDKRLLENPIRVHHNQFVADAQGGNGYTYAIECSTPNIEVDHNYFHYGIYPIANFGSTVDGANIHHNIFHDIESQSIMHAKNGWRNAKFVNNYVIFTPSGHSERIAPIYIGSTKSDALTIRDNIFYDSRSTRRTQDIVRFDEGGSLGDNCQISNNLFYNWDTDGDNAQEADPKFLDNFQLAADSPARKMGIDGLMLVDAGLDENFFFQSYRGSDTGVFSVHLIQSGNRSQDYVEAKTGDKIETEVFWRNKKYYKFKAQSSQVTYASDNRSVATVDANGLITVVGEGVAAVTAAMGGKKGTLIIVSGDEPTGLKLMVDKTVISAGQMAGAKVLQETKYGFTKDVTDTCTFTSSDTASLRIDKYGVYTARKQGNAVITAVSSIPGTKSVSCAITINE